MTLTSKSGLLILLFLTLSACSVFETVQSSRLCADDNGNFTTCKDIVIDKQTIVKQAPSLFTSDVHFIQLSDYTQQIAMDLKSDIPAIGLHGSIIVTPFVRVHEAIEEDDYLGYDLATYVSHDLRKLGVETSDHSLGGSLYRTEKGSIEFSVEQQDIFIELDASYVLAGNIRQTYRGLMINAKIVELKSGKLMASSVKLLPNVVLNSIL